MPCVNRPTRATHASATLIDNLYLNANLYKNCQSGILISDLSDHFPIIACVGTKSSSEYTESEHINFSYHESNDTAYAQLRQLLNQVNWNFANSVSLDEAYVTFINKITDCLDVVAREKNITISHKVSTCPRSRSK